MIGFDGGVGMIGGNAQWVILGMDLTGYQRRQHGLRGCIRDRIFWLDGDEWRHKMGF